MRAWGAPLEEHPRSAVFAVDCHPKAIQTYGFSEFFWEAMQVIPASMPSIRAPNRTLGAGNATVRCAEEGDLRRTAATDLNKNRRS